MPALYVKNASVLNDLKKYNDAIDASNEALSIDPKNPLALTNRGRANDGLGNYLRWQTTQLRFLCSDQYRNTLVSSAALQE